MEAEHVLVARCHGYRWSRYAVVAAGLAVSPGGKRFAADQEGCLPDLHHTAVLGLGVVRGYWMEGPLERRRIDHSVLAGQRHWQTGSDKQETQDCRDGQFNSMREINWMREMHRWCPIPGC